MVDPITAQLTQGVTPDKITFTLSLGAGLSMFPLLGFTSLLNLGVGVWLKLNQPILQTLNYLLGPLHLIMIVVYVRLGETLFRAERIPFSISELLRTARDASMAEFFHRFGWAGVHACTAWLISLPVIVLTLQFILRPIIRHMAERLWRPL